MFPTVSIPFDAFQALPSANHRWLLTCFSRYVDRAGRAFPGLRRLASDARMSVATVSRRMKDMADLGVFHREREPGGRYRYVLAEAYRPRWPGKGNRGVSAPKGGVSPDAEQGVPYAARQKAKPSKHTYEGNARTREGAQETAPPRSAPGGVSLTPTPLSATIGFDISPIDPWRARVRQYRDNPGRWIASWGPIPGQRGCIVSAAILTAFGYDPA